MQKKPPQINIFWFRRDLRLNDNHGLYLALKDNLPVLPLFIFDKAVLSTLSSDDPRVTAIYYETDRLSSELKQHGSSLKTMHGEVRKCFSELMEEFNIRTVYVNNDYEPYSILRDDRIRESLAHKGVNFRSVKDQVIFEKDEVIKDDGKPYLVFTPYMKKWKEKRKLLPEIILHPSEKLIHNFFKSTSFTFCSLQDLGFKKTTLAIPDRRIDEEKIRTYHKTRDFPAIEGTSRLGFHLRFGTISIRKLIKTAEQLNEKFLNELIWREFYMMILWHFPHVVSNPFKKEYRFIPWINDEKEFERWKNGETGIPIIDAGMRQLSGSGYMHNRVRMIAAGFLVKNLLIDWQWGETYFASKLLDFELASNNGGWQWSAGTGADAAPYFRIFNPYIQAKKFDPEEEYIRTWIPEYITSTYPTPMIDIRKSGQRAIERYRAASNEFKNSLK